MAGAQLAFLFGPVSRATTLEERLALGRALLGQYHAAIWAGDQDRAETLEEEVDQVAVALNGGTSFGMATPGGGLYVLRDAVRAQEGSEPHWGQPGVFLVSLEAGCRVRVDYTGLFGTCANGFVAHIVDRDQPFLSETGYYSFISAGHGAELPAQTTVAAWCRTVMDTYVLSKNKETRKQPGLVPFDADGLARQRAQWESRQQA